MLVGKSCSFGVNALLPYHGTWVQYMMRALLDLKNYELVKCVSLCGG